jgi:hypothetical protein
MNRTRRILILSLLGLAIIGTLMLKNSHEETGQEIQRTAELPILLDMTVET